ncbi:sugar phosphate nucleotidyltransferase [Dickeya oryzae]|uniref:NTP transferase domain-containing protein n=1 Tax=Dickeya oryzae TaxID=1240404 RepID=UPI002097CEC4|nr:sugar phosphate nucleotidyltransferase [Dickeya oryzae]MCO7253983.1 sugar phosphate nucleotidyltransferase [Dickeya oryzae]
MNNKFQIVIPMSGFGERFRKAGYLVPKPLIEIEGKPIIAHVIDMFPGETDFIFICNQEHLDESSYRMKEILNKYCPTGRILGISPHKLGPVHAVLQAEKIIKKDIPVVVNYCDFTCYWNWQHFKEWTVESKCDGAVPAYKGFHPHTLGTTNYAYMKEDHGWLRDIQEKQPYTDDRMNEYASSGTYYYSSGGLMLDSFHEVVRQQLSLNGEYYVSLTYKPLLAEGKRIGVYPLQHFMQWGTPEDVREYNYWSDAFHHLLTAPLCIDKTQSGTIIIPMAGLGERFRREGYKLTKPLIPVSGRPMVLQATSDLPASQRYAFILRSDMPGLEDVSQLISQQFINSSLINVERVTEGQACTALIGLSALDKDDEELGHVTFGACDNGALYDYQKLAQLFKDTSADVIVWGVRGYVNAARHPRMFGWIDADSDNVINHISVKTPLSDLATDPVVLGTFTFRRGSDARRCIEHLISRDGRINGEFYLDSCINDAIELGLRCILFEVDSYLSWGTPNDLKTFNYWQSCFHLWPTHPYDLSADIRVDSVSAAQLDSLYSSWQPELPR